MVQFSNETITVDNRNYTSYSTTHLLAGCLNSCDGHGLSTITGIRKRNEQPEPSKVVSNDRQVALLFDFGGNSSIAYLRARILLVEEGDFDQRHPGRKGL